jgi:hypothetical protein
MTADGRMLRAISAQSLEWPTLADTVRCCDGKLRRFNVFECDGQPMAMEIPHNGSEVSTSIWSGYATSSDYALLQATQNKAEAAG